MNVRKANRLKDYDYSPNGFYFVTICTKNKKEYFGKINDGEMVLNDYGEIANQLWLEIPDHFEEGRQYQKLPVVIGSYKSAVTP